MFRKEEYKPGQRVRIDSRDGRRYLGMGTYLGEDLYFLDRGTMAVGRFFDIRASFHPYPGGTNVQLTKEVPIYSVDQQDFVSMQTGSAPVDVHLTIYELKSYLWEFRPVVFGCTYLYNTPALLMMKQLELPHERHLTLVA